MDSYRDKIHRVIDKYHRKNPIDFVVLDRCPHVTLPTTEKIFGNPLSKEEQKWAAAYILEVAREAKLPVKNTFIQFAEYLGRESARRRTKSEGKQVAEATEVLTDEEGEPHDRQTALPTPPPPPSSQALPAFAPPAVALQLAVSSPPAPTVPPTAPPAEPAPLTPPAPSQHHNPSGSRNTTSTEQAQPQAAQPQAERGRTAKARTAKARAAQARAAQARTAEAWAAQPRAAQAQAVQPQVAQPQTAQPGASWPAWLEEEARKAGQDLMDNLCTVNSSSLRRKLGVMEKREKGQTGFYARYDPDYFVSLELLARICEHVYGKDAVHYGNPSDDHYWKVSYSMTRPKYVVTLEGLVNDLQKNDTAWFGQTLPIVAETLLQKEGNHCFFCKPGDIEAKLRLLEKVMYLRRNKGFVSYHPETQMGFPDVEELKARLRDLRAHGNELWPGMLAEFIT